MEVSVADLHAMKRDGRKIVGVVAWDFQIAKIAGAEPDLVFVGLGFPKQERVVSRLRPALPAGWFVGCGAAVNFVAGDVERAPRWMQRTGLEWAHRLGTDPRRLAGRYLRHDAAYALRLLARAPGQRTANLRVR